MLFALLCCCLGSNDAVGGLCGKSDVARREIVLAYGGSYKGLQLGRERDEFEREHGGILDATAGSHDGH